jgi:hypothetical protein
MTERQAGELSRLQSHYWRAVADSDTHKQREWLEVMIYYIRKQIYKRVQWVMLSEDATAAARFMTEDVRLHEGYLPEFYRRQAVLLALEANKADERKEEWGEWIKWLDETIEAEILRHCAKYITITKKKKNG